MGGYCPKESYKRDGDLEGRRQAYLKAELVFFKIKKLFFWGDGFLK